MWTSWSTCDAGCADTAVVEVAPMMFWHQTWSMPCASLSSSYFCHPVLLQHLLSTSNVQHLFLCSWLPMINPNRESGNCANSRSRDPLLAVAEMTPSWSLAIGIFRHPAPKISMPSSPGAAGPGTPTLENVHDDAHSKRRITVYGTRFRSRKAKHE